jgi:hypothetical protein
MTEEEHKRFVQLARYWCQQRELSRTGKSPQIKSQALRQMELVNKEQERLLETEK